MLAGQRPSTRPQQRTTEQACHHFPVITGGRPFLVILPSAHPSVCCSLIPAQGATLFPRRLPVMSSGWRGTDRRVGSGQISSPKWHVLVARAQQTCHQCPALPEGVGYISPSQTSGPRGWGDRVGFLSRPPLTVFPIGSSTAGSILHPPRTPTARSPQS